MNFSTALLSLFLLLTSSQVYCMTVTVSCRAASSFAGAIFQDEMRPIMDNADEIWKCGRKHLNKWSPDRSSYQSCISDISGLSIELSGALGKQLKAVSFRNTYKFNTTLNEIARVACSEINRQVSGLGSNSTTISLSGTFGESSEPASDDSLSSATESKNIGGSDGNEEEGNLALGFVILGGLALLIGVGCYFMCCRPKNPESDAPSADPNILNGQQPPYYDQGGYPPQSPQPQIYSPQPGYQQQPQGYYPQQGYPQQGYPQGGYQQQQ